MHTQICQHGAPQNAQSLASKKNEVAIDYNAGFQSAIAGLKELSLLSLWQIRGLSGWGNKRETAISK